VPRLDVDAQPELGRGLGGLRADDGDDRTGVRLSGDPDQVADRGRGREEHGVEAARLDRVADLGRRRRRPHGTVRGHVVHLPAALGQPGGQRLRRDVGAGQQDPADRVEHLVVRRELGQQPLAGLLAGRHQLRPDAEGPHGVGRGVTDASDLHAAEVPGVEPVLGELLPHGPYRVHGGEDDPRITPVHQPLDRPLHLRRGARRLHSDRRHLAGDRAVRAQVRTHHAGLLLGTGNEHPPAVQWTVFPPAQLVAVGDARADGQHDAPGEPERRGDEAVRGGGGRVLRVAGAVAGHRERGRAVEAGGEQPVPDGSQVARVDGERQRATVGGHRERLEVQRGHVVGVGHGAHAGQRHAGVRRHALRLADARHDLEVNGGAGDSLHLLDHGLAPERVAAHQMHRAQPGPGGGEQHLGHVARGALGRAQLRRFGPLSTGHLGRAGGTDRLQQGLGDAAVEDDVVGRGERLVRSAGQQSRVAGAGPDERDAAGGLAGAGHF
jgi:hypothetical protein